MNKLLRTLSVLLMAALFAPMNMQAENELQSQGYQYPPDGSTPPIVVRGEYSGATIRVGLRTEPGMPDFPCGFSASISIGTGYLGTYVPYAEKENIHFYPFVSSDGTLGNNLTSNEYIAIGGFYNTSDYPILFETVRLLIKIDNPAYYGAFLNSYYGCGIESEFSQSLKENGLLDPKKPLKLMISFIY